MADTAITSPSTFLDSLPPSARARIDGLGAVLDHPAGHCLMREGDPAHDVVIILSGLVTVVVVADSGADVILGIRGPGDLLGELAVVDQGLRSATVVGVGPTRVRRIPAADLLAAVAQERALDDALRRVIARRQRQSDRNLVEVVTAGSYSRLVRFLLELAERYGEPLPGGAVRIALGLTQDQLAEAAVMSRESFQRGLRVLRTRQILAIGRRVITVRTDLLRAELKVS